MFNKQGPKIIINSLINLRGQLNYMNSDALPICARSRRCEVQNELPYL